MTPADIIAQRAAGIITTEEMMDTLLSRWYTFGAVVTIDGVATDAYVAGDWDQVVMALYCGDLTGSEFQRLADRARHQASAIPSCRQDPPRSCADRDREQITNHLARLIAASFNADDIAEGLGITDSQVHQKRVTRELWAIPHGDSWRFPASQFDLDPALRQPMRQVRGLAHVFPALPSDLHPIAVDGFLHTSQPDLYRDWAHTPLEWLRDGGDISAAVTTALANDWYGR